MSQLSFKLLLVVGLAAHPAHLTHGAEAGGDLPKTNSQMRGLPDFLPPPTPPTHLFRQLLATPPAERDALLANRSATQKTLLLNKLREYELLTPGQRELVLRTMELRWYLTSLMHLPPSNRTTRLVAMPPADRPLVEDRLNHWDRMGALSKQEILEYETAIRFSTPSAGGLPNQISTLTNMLPEQRRKTEAEIARWQALPPDRRQSIYWNFGRLFVLPPVAKPATMMSATERQEMDRSLQDFTKLPKEQQDLCIRGFKKFSDLTPAERDEFLQSAERWQAMNEDDRQTWRKLVSLLPQAMPISKFPPAPRLTPQAVSFETNR